MQPRINRTVLVAAGAAFAAVVSLARGAGHDLPGNATGTNREEAAEVHGPGNVTWSGPNADPRPFTSKVRQMVRVTDYATPQDALNTGASVYFPDGDYIVTEGLRPIVSGQMLLGAGYRSRIMVPGGGWALSSPNNFAIINISNVSHVRVTGLRIYGTKTQDLNHTPKLVYLYNANNVQIDHNWLENTAFEGIWAGGNAASNYSVAVADNFVYDVGWPAGKYAGLPAIQANGDRWVVANNILNNVGTGIGLSGSRITCSGNVIKDLTVAGIGTGDGGENGPMTIANNQIEFEASISNARFGMTFGSSAERSTDHTVTVVGNNVSIIGDVAIASPRAYFIGSAGSFHFIGNTAEIYKRGTGFEAAGSAVGTTELVLNSNIVKIRSEAAAASYGFVVAPYAGWAIKAVSGGNRVFGMTITKGSYAYYYRASGGGTVTASLSGDWSEGGNVAVGALYPAGSPGVPIFDHFTNATPTAAASE